MFDFCILGKVIGGGFLLVVIVGCVDIMVYFDKMVVGVDGWFM